MISQDKRLTRLDFRFGNVDWERGTVKQYELERDERVWRVFINGCAKNGFVVLTGRPFPGRNSSKSSVTLSR